ncbi:helix-turn-helix domain-containing protein [Asticcacaulis sp. YBE204]|uniref:helix-turn-helix domain-containing protein n=1 Tax=Asticcacaulis sp. YBE204 TaxID=1282363 RepID=UPI0003C3C59C|nr:helix-turn-helix transcriptional regulator [Asticcacaulis sp. YBE204]ESQ76880.1 Cro/Cl family transcriptional regulator [Asticcacaulis sp. YBE204]
MGTIKGIHPVDRQVGLNIRRLRKARGWSQEILAEGIGITFQQVQKYERGTNRVSCSKLMDICERMQIHPVDILPAPQWDAAPVAVCTWFEDAQWVYFRNPHLLRDLSRLNPLQLKAIHAAARAFEPV